MAPTTKAPKLSKKRKLGKGKKKSWRAANVVDIEEFLDDERRQRETGGLASEKSDELLFFVDKAKQKQVKPSGGRVSKESRRKRPLKSTALLNPADHIQSVIKPLPENYRKGKRTQRILEDIDRRAASNVRVIAAQQREEYVQEKLKAKRKKGQLPEITTDIWNDDDEIQSIKVKRPKKLFTKPSKLSATSIPHPGASINPSYEDHQELLQEALDVEERQRKTALRTVNYLQLPISAEKATQETYLEEMAAGLVDDSASEEEEENEEGDVLPSVRMPHRKTKRQRAAERKLGEQMRKKKAEADKNRRENMVFRVRTLKSEIRQQEEKEKETLEKRIKLKEEKPFKTRRLGKLKFEEPPIALKLSEELVPSLRQVKPEVHILEDVYKNILRRNIVEPRQKQTYKPKYKRKKYTKKSHKEFV